MAKGNIRRMEIEPAQNGGHTVTHHFKETARHSAKHGMMPGYSEPESHVFGPGDGHAMLAHIANHLSIPEGDIGGEKAEEDAEHDEGAE